MPREIGRVEIEYLSAFAQMAIDCVSLWRGLKGFEQKLAEENELMTLFAEWFAENNAPNELTAKILAAKPQNMKQLAAKVLVDSMLGQDGSSDEMIAELKALAGVAESPADA